MRKTETRGTIRTQRKHGRHSVLLAAIVGMGAAVLMPQAAGATTFTWTALSGGNASGSWNAAGNWNSGAGPVASGSGNTADFSTLDITADSTIALDAPQTISNLIFGDTATATAG